MLELRKYIKNIADSKTFYDLLLESFECIIGEIWRE